MEKRSGAAQEGKVKVNGADLHYEVRGNGPHPIVCIPGALGTIETDFRPQMEHFGREGSGFTIVSFDPRGYGQSRPNERFTEGTNFFLSDAKDAHALMQTLSFQKYSVIGWSNGGIASLFLASKYPESVRNLVALGANAYFSQKDVELYENLKDGDDDTNDLMVKIYGDSLQELLEKWIDAVHAFRARNNGDIFTKELSKIVCPTLIVHGEKDPLVLNVHATYLKDRIKGSRLEMFQEGRHGPHLEFHQKFNEMVEKFLNK